MMQPNRPQHLPPMRPDGVPFLGNLLDFRRQPLQFWLDTGQQAPVMRVRLAHRELWVITDADWFQHVFQKNVRNFPRQRRIRRPDIVDGKETHTVFTAPNWEQWLWRRRLLQPAFHRRQIATFADTMVHEALRLVDGWLPGMVVDLKMAMKQLTMQIIGRTMFSTGIEQANVLAHTFELTSSFTYRNSAAVLPIPLWVPTLGNRAVLTAQHTRRKLLSQIVADRYANETVTRDDASLDLLDMLIAARLEEDDAVQFSATDLVSEMTSIVFAGHETTALTLMWTLYALSRYPSIEKRIRDEIANVLGDRTVTLNDIGNMPYTERVLLETMRVYPPVFATLRETANDDRIADQPIPADSVLLLNIRGLHRSTRYWTKPNEFDPDRFLPERAAGRHKFAYQPFISGPKKCIGDNFAMMEMRLVLPTILQQMRLRYAGAQPPREKPGFVMETDHPVVMQVM